MSPSDYKPKWHNLLILSVTFVSVRSLEERGCSKHEPSESLESFVWNTALSLKHKHSVLTEASPNEPNVVFCWTSSCIMFPFNICLKPLHMKLLMTVILPDKVCLALLFCLNLVTCLDSHSVCEGELHSLSQLQIASLFWNSQIDTPFPIAYLNSSPICLSTFSFMFF